MWLHRVGTGCPRRQPMPRARVVRGSGPGALGLGADMVWSAVKLPRWGRGGCLGHHGWFGLWGHRVLTSHVRLALPLHPAAIADARRGCLHLGGCLSRLASPPSPCPAKWCRPCHRGDGVVHLGMAQLLLRHALVAFAVVPVMLASDHCPWCSVPVEPCVGCLGALSTCGLCHPLVAGHHGPSHGPLCAPRAVLQSRHCDSKPLRLSCSAARHAVTGGRAFRRAMLC